MARIELDKDARQAAVRALSKYLKDELDVEVSGFDAQFLLDFIAERIAPHFYNQALTDAQAVLMKRIEGVTEAIEELVKPVKA